MQIAIHHRPGSFSDKWIEYCDQHNVPYKLVDCYASDIIQQMQDCDGLMWHWAHNKYVDKIFALQLISALEYSGIKVFPDSKTCWHYDDKIAQKYSLEAIGAPIVNTYVFYERHKALKWAEEALYPKVFKLRSGAGSMNVKLVPNKKNAKKFIKKAFSSGFKSIDKKHFLKDRIHRFRCEKNLSSFLNISRGLGRLFISKKDEGKMLRECNYVYFQDLIAGNEFDIRIVVIGERAFGIKRMVRKNDFRASGSGSIIYAPEEIPMECVEIAFDLNKKIKAQSIAFDFVLSERSSYVIEISYAYTSKAYWNCPGFWDSTLRWHDSEVVPEYFILEDFFKKFHST